jgi:hypothetical protein
MAEGKTKALRELPDRFVRGADKRLSTTGWMRRALGLPYSTLERVDESDGNPAHYRVGRRLTLDEFKRLREVVYDTEWRRWERDAGKQVKLANLNHLSLEQIITGLEKRGVGVAAELARHSREELVKLVEKNYNETVGTSGFEPEPMFEQFCVYENGELHAHSFEHLCGTDGRVIIMDLPAGRTIVHVHKAQNVLEMQVRVQEFYDTYRFTLLRSYNGMSYDALHKRNYTEEQAKIAKKLRRMGVKAPQVTPFRIGGARPNVTGIVGFAKQVTIPTIDHFDDMHDARNSFPFTKDKRLPTTVSLVNCRKMEKREDYDDLTRLSIEMEYGSEEAADELRVYAIEDTVELAVERPYYDVKRPMLGSLFRKGSESISATSRRKLAFDAFQYEHIERLKESVRWKREMLQEYNKLSSWEAFRKLLKNEALQEILPQGLLHAANPAVRPDFTQAAMYYFSPFLFILEPVRNENPVIQQILQHIRDLDIGAAESSTQRTLQRFDLIHKIEEGYLLPYVLEELHRDFSNYRRNVQKYAQRFDALVRFQLPGSSKRALLNRSGNFLLFPSAAAGSAEFQKAAQHTAFKVAEGSFFNISRGSFMGTDGVTTYKREVDAKGNLGFRTIFEREVIVGMIEKALEEGPRAAAMYCLDEHAALVSGRVEREKLIYHKDHIPRDADEYSAWAQRQQRVKAIVAGRMEKGAEFSKVRLADGMHEEDEFLRMRHEEIFTARNIDFLLAHYFGQLTRTGRDLGKGKIGIYARPLLREAGISVREAEEYILRNAAVPRQQRLDTTEMRTSKPDQKTDVGQLRLF